MYIRTYSGLEKQRDPRSGLRNYTNMRLIVRDPSNLITGTIMGRIDSPVPKEGCIRGGFAPESSS